VQFGLVISILLHAAILGGALFSIQSRPEMRVLEPEPVAVGMISPSEVTKVRQGVRTAKLLEAEPKESPKGEMAKKEAPRPKMAALAPPPPPPPPVEQKAEPAAPKVAEPPPPPAVPPAEVQKKLEAEQQERDRQAALATEKLKAEQQKQAEEKRLAEDKQRAEEQEKADAAKRAEEQKLAEERKRAEEEQRRAEEQKRAEELKRQAELKKKRDEEKRRREAALKKKREEEKKRQDEEKKRLEAEAAKNKKWDADSISALLNKVPDKAAPPPPSEATDQPTKNKGPTLGSREGRDKQISASEIAMLNGIIGNRLAQCWRLASAGGGSDTPVVTLRWHLRPDGSLEGDPQVIERTRNDTLFDLAAESAIRAVRECSPFPLPREKYNVWKTITRDFDPASMLR
jgi:colicin import membrane protein